MANTLTNLIPTVVEAFDAVSRELVGFIPSVNRDPRTDRVAKNQTLYSPATAANTVSDITPAMTVTAASDRTVANKTLTISNYKASSFNFTGEESYGLGGAYSNIVQDEIEQAVRAVVNQMESDIATAAYLGASRAYGTAGTTPFASTLGDPAQIKKILDDNGAPAGNRSLIVNTTAGAAVRTLAQLTKANEAGTSMTLRDGELLNIHGLSLKESAQVPTVTAGAMASATSTNAAFTVGQTVIPLATAGTGVVAAGDIITFANDTNKYVVASVSFAGSNPASGDSITLAAPGLRVAQSAATRAITVVSTAARNTAFSKSAIVLATRLPALPNGGDIASDRTVITDARSGISLELAMYPGYRMVKYEIAAAWGVTVFKPEHVAILLG